MEKFDAASHFLDAVEIPSQKSIDDSKLALETSFNEVILEMAGHSDLTPMEAEARIRDFHNKLWGIEPPELV